MSPNLRTALLAGGAALALLVAGGIGYAIGRSGGGDAVASPVPTPSVSSPSSPLPTGAVSAEPISAGGAILRSGDQVTPGAATAACETLVTAGLTGECGDVTVPGGRVVWIVERSAVTTGVSGYAVRILAYSPVDAGWVESLHADDLEGRRWASISLLPADLTGDAVQELLVGYRGPDDKEPLDLDVVSYTQDGQPIVVAHPARADRGSLVVEGPEIRQYGGIYTTGEQDCCPGSFELRTMAFDSGQLFLLGTENVSPGVVPPSQL